MSCKSITYAGIIRKLISNNFHLTTFYFPQHLKSDVFGFNICNVHLGRIGMFDPVNMLYLDTFGIDNKRVINYELKNLEEFKSQLKLLGISYKKMQRR